MIWCGLLCTLDAMNCVGRMTLNEFDEFMMNHTAAGRSPFPDTASFLEVGAGDGAGSGSPMDTTKPWAARAAPWGGLTALQLCADIQVPVTAGISVQVVLDGILKTGSGPLYNGFDVTAKVAAVVGFGWLKGSIEVKGKVSLEATDCEGWSQVISHWSAAVLDEALHDDAIKKMATDEAKQKELKGLITKLDEVVKGKQSNWNKVKAQMGGAKKVNAALELGVAKMLAEKSREILAVMPGQCTMSWSAGVSVGVSAGGTEGCGSFPWVLIEGGSTWGQDIAAGKVVAESKTAGGVIKITPICETLYCFQVSASYDSDGDMAISTYVHLPADTSIAGSFPKMIWDKIDAAQNENKFAESVGGLMKSFKGAADGGLKTALLAAEGKADGALAGAVPKEIGGPGATLIAAMIFKSLDALKTSVVDTAQVAKGEEEVKASVLAKVKDLCKGFFQALGKNIADPDLLEGGKQDFKEFVLKSIPGVNIQDNLAFEVSFKRNAKGKKTLEGTISALKVHSVDPSKMPIPMDGVKMAGVYQKGKSFDLFGSKAMHDHVWGPIWEGAVAPVVMPVVNAVKAGVKAVKGKPAPPAAPPAAKPAAKPAAAKKKKFKQVHHALRVAKHKVLSPAA